MHQQQPGPGTANATIVDEVVIEIVELEEHVKQHPDKEPPRAKHYAFRVDKTRVVVDTPHITGAEILAKVSKSPEQFKLYQHKRGHQPVQIAPTKEVNLREPGVERFTTMPKDTTEGLIADGRRDFKLPAADEAYLDGLRLAWEAILDGATRWITIRDWRLPPGYNLASVTLALRIPDNYADAQLDMVYFQQHLARTDGRPIGGLSSVTICDAQWQQWSRHRTGANPWRTGVDDIASHLALVDDWLQREFAVAA